jgi:hypothetical protein
MGARAVSPLPARASHRVPVSTSISQAYYWKNAWQRGEHEALADLAAGRARIFSSTTEALRYLLSTDDE